jgi:methionine-rich copper-binding protein CopC
MTHRLAGLVAGALASLAVAGVVLAHAELVSSDPPAGGVLTTTPYTLTATFDDELTSAGSSIVVVNAAGTEVATGTVSDADEFTLTAELPALPTGLYHVRWTAVSADDAAVERGTYTFNVTVGAASGSPLPTPPPNDGEPVTDSKDPLVAVGLAAIAIVLILAFIFFRRRR